MKSVMSISFRSQRQILTSGETVGVNWKKRNPAWSISFFLGHSVARRSMLPSTFFFLRAKTIVSCLMWRNSRAVSIQLAKSLPGWPSGFMFSSVINGCMKACFRMWILCIEMHGGSSMLERALNLRMNSLLAIRRQAAQRSPGWI